MSPLFMKNYSKNLNFQFSPKTSKKPSFLNIPKDVATFYEKLLQNLQFFTKSSKNPLFFLKNYQKMPPLSMKNYSKILNIQFSLKTSKKPLEKISKKSPHTSIEKKIPHYCINSTSQQHYLMIFACTKLQTYLT